MEINKLFFSMLFTCLTLLKPAFASEVSFDSLSSLMQRRVQPNYEFKRMKTKFFRNGKLWEGISTGRGAKRKVIYVCRKDSINVSSFFPMLTIEKIDDFNCIVKKNRVKLKNEESIFEYLTEIFSFHDYLYLDDSTQLMAAFESYYSSANKLPTCSNNSINYEILLNLTDRANRLEYIEDSLIESKSLLIRSFSIERTKSIGLCTEAYPFSFFLCTIVIDKMGLVRRYSIDYIGSMSDVQDVK